MCGIIGYVGSKNTTDVLLNGLYALEYRGYDSAGVCISDGKNSEIIKSVGRVKLLDEKIKKECNINGTLGIAHTRWATNGCSSIANAHPHKVGSITLVHNGIIENSDLLKEKLISLGYKFKSETDTEVAAALIDLKYKEEHDILKAIDSACHELVGSYAFGIMVEDTNKLYAVRKDSPLLIGLSDEGNFLASDITAIIKYTNKYMLLDKDEICELSNNGIVIYKDGKEIKKEVQISDSTGVSNDKMGYKHHMLKEIMEEPTVLKNLILKYKNEDNRKELDLSNYKNIDIVACGSAMYAGLVGENLIEEYANIKVDVYPASEYRYMKKIYGEDSLVILISQSGETADTIAAMREAKRLGIKTLGIVNNPDSTIARECDKIILTNAGVEIAVATTKAYILQVCVLSLIAYTTAKSKKLLDNLDYDIFMKLPDKVSDVLNDDDTYKNIASKIYNINSCFYIGRGLDYALCMEGSLKLKEISYIHSEAYQAGELKHGTISLVEENMPVFTIITDKNLKDKTLSNLKETEARGALGIIVTTSELDDNYSELKIIVPSSNKLTQSMLVVPALQLLSYYIALNRGCDIDKPRNLAKSVTVE